MKDSQRKPLSLKEAIRGLSSIIGNLPNKELVCGWFLFVPTIASWVCVMFHVTIDIRNERKSHHQTKLFTILFPERGWPEAVGARCARHRVLMSPVTWQDIGGVDSAPASNDTCLIIAQRYGRGCMINPNRALCTRRNHPPSSSDWCDITGHQPAQLHWMEPPRDLQWPHRSIGSWSSRLCGADELWKVLSSEKCNPVIESFLE